MNISPRRIIYLDLMRALAVLMMVEGHTTDTFLADQFRNPDSWLYQLWLIKRGFTAPIFMFTSGVVFTYLLKLQNHPFWENLRVYKGFKRVITLLLIGYLLRFPTATLIDYQSVSLEQWYIFFTVDALHLIGFGLLFILIFEYISETFKINSYIVFLLGALFFFIIHPFTENIQWTAYMPVPLAAYFYHKTGSLFPLFPWTGYVISGALLGSYLAKNPDVFTSRRFSKNLLIIGIVLIIAAHLFLFINYLNELQKDAYYFILLRLGAVIVLNSIMSYIAVKLDSIPDIVKWIGRHTLVVYAVHVIILYGSAWVPGLNTIFAKSMNLYLSVCCAIVMIAAMIIMVWGIEKYKLTFKKEVARS
ncbi:heparan-alpha-glucosaminide N-acetyltransferase domain-containing protein [Melioribacter sp. OK-6-Me]|uniref:heparan-alpha-glucosaminide N-acetyltransferase domain-containing protein n=1 Tax=unclassified Melioribacter TaxID=2627329 RepID=UPI003EDA0212